MDFLQSLIQEYNFPLLSAFVLGLMTAISPCPLATNITATAFISKNISSKRKVLLSGIVYSLGRAFTYTVIGLVLYLGASKFHIQRFFSQNGEKFLGPLLIVIGLVMLNVIRLNFLGKSSIEERFSAKFKNKGLLGSFLLGILFALAFCPYSGALYFGVLIPMTISSSSGLYLPFVFAIGTGLPVILFAYLLAFAAHRIGGVYQKIRIVEKYMRYIAGTAFILVGLYYICLFAGLI
ncbi:aromatic aminobenezylarsenical efflux permease ArsG family transporter [Neolewinella persica]|uniref:aromatic aminobenezylarsenical efflux permease ArsG family transporter n=1 Tax=Neolewinella persica TaxID=70998 RepID=UPI00037074D3|nr:aromatic aminobenezylarsenical efflux permease ArsG family transporter [Neolewinella persica]